MLTCLIILSLAPFIAHRIESLNIDVLVDEALEAWKNQEMIEIVNEEETGRISEVRLSIHTFNKSASKNHHIVGILQKGLSIL